MIEGEMPPILSWYAQYNLKHCPDCGNEHIVPTEIPGFVPIELVGCVYIKGLPNLSGFNVMVMCYGPPGGSIQSAPPALQHVIGLN